MDLLDRLRLEYPIFQVGMGGGLSPPALAAAVSRAGALGTLGTVPAPMLAKDIALARSLAPSKPLAVNILLPFQLRAHVDACIAGRVDAVVLFYGFAPDAARALRNAGIFVVHQVGTVDEAVHAVCDGADALIVQGIEWAGICSGDVLRSMHCVMCSR